MDAAALEKDWGIRPDQVVDFLALTGDAVDNVPGVPLIGPVNASALIKEFGTLDQLLENVDRVKGPKKQQSLRDHAETALRARQLVTLRDDLPLALDWEALKTQSPDREALLAICTECGFHGFRDELGALAQRESRRPSPGRPGWPNTGRSIPRSSSRQFLEELRRQPRFCVDTETTALDPLKAELVGLSFCWKAGEAVLPAGARAVGRGCSTRRRRSRPCGRSWPTRPSRRSARTSSTTCWPWRGPASRWPGP